MSTLPTAKGKVRNHVVTVLRDTGCSINIVRWKLVEDREMLTKIQKCILVNRFKRVTPSAMIEIDTLYLKGSVEAICMNNPVFDLIMVKNELLYRKYQLPKSKIAQPCTQLLVPKEYMNQSQQAIRDRGAQH